MLPRGSDHRELIYDFNPVYISSKGFDQNLFEAIMTHQDEIKGQEYKVDYSFIDFRPMNYQKKINAFLEKDYHDELKPIIVSRMEI